MTGILVGSAIVATRSVIDQLGPASLAFLRYVIGFLCLVGPAWLGGGISFARRDWLPIGLLGIAQFGVLVALLNYALEFIPSALAALIFATMPLLAMLLSAVLGQERITLLKTVAVLMTILGVGLALGERVTQSGPAAQAWIGDLAAFGSALSGAVCSVLYRPYLRKYPTLSVSAFAMLASVGFLALLAAGEGFFAALPHLTPAGWGAVLFIGLNSGIGYFLWLWSLSKLGATRVTVFMALGPITAATLGTLLLDEPLSLLLLLGLACVVFGLWLAQQGNPATAAAPSDPPAR